jgi:hypothetical protein
MAISIDVEEEPAVPFSCVRIRCVKFVFLRHFLYERSEDSRGLDRIRDAYIAATADTASGTAESALLNAPRRLLGRFGIVSSASNRTPAEWKEGSIHNK